MYNVVTPALPDGAHQSARNMEVLRPLGAVTDGLAEEMYVQDVERSAARTMLERHGVTRRKPVIALHPGAGKIKNRWPVARFAQLASRLHHDLAADLVLCWGPNERDLASEFDCLDIPLLKFPPGTIRDLAALLTQCNLVVCNDTGVMHISAAVGTPLVAVFGPTDANQW
jgi:ADP-heptose:LPS heptosyltransferase